MRTTIALAAAVLTTTASVAAAAADAPIATYTAQYRVEYKEKDVGTSEFKVTYDAASETYRFESRTIVKGFLKLMSPNPVVERSAFRVANGAIQPIEYWYEDGSRKGEDNVHAVFDWDKGVATVDGENGRRELPLAAGTLDRATLQVALMRDLAVAGGAPARYMVADADGVEPYEYTRGGEHSITTGVGALETVAYTQQREGSSRSTSIWVAASLSYLPVRIEQRRDGEVQTAFTLKAVDGLSATGAP